MKTSVVKFFAGSEIRLAVLSVLLLGMAGTCQGQASASAARPAAPSATASQAQPVAQPGQTAAAGVPAPKGTHEGIKVHGHWTIEVRNPDGKVATHREFENSLVNGPGAATLVSLLVGNFVPGGAFIALSDAANPQTGGPCPPVGGSTNCLLVGSLIAPTPSSWFTTVPGFSGGCIPANNCSPSLTITPNMLSQGWNTGLLFSGSIPGSMTETGNISAVYLFPEGCGGNATTTVIGTASPTTCASTAAPTGLSLTSANLATAVSVTAGQSVAVTVQLSFQ